MPIKSVITVLLMLFLSGCELTEFSATGSVELNPSTGTKQISDPTPWRSVTTVNATMNLYFLFDQSEAQFGEEGEDFIPQTVELPEGMSSITVTAEGYWSWGGGCCESDANGEYTENVRQSYVRSGIARTGELRVGSVVGMWSDGTENNEGELLVPFEIGAEADLQIPEGATQLILGMHDGYQWTNNSGSMEIELSGLLE